MSAGRLSVSESPLLQSAGGGCYPSEDICSTVRQTRWFPLYFCFLSHLITPSSSSHQSAVNTQKDIFQWSVSWKHHVVLIFRTKKWKKVGTSGAFVPTCNRGLSPVVPQTEDTSGDTWTCLWDTSCPGRAPERLHAGTFERPVNAPTDASGSLSLGGKMLIFAQTWESSATFVLRGMKEIKAAAGVSVGDVGPEESEAAGLGGGRWFGAAAVSRANRLESPSFRCHSLRLFKPFSIHNCISSFSPTRHYHSHFLSFSLPPHHHPAPSFCIYCRIYFCWKVSLVHLLVS